MYRWRRSLREKGLIERYSSVHELFSPDLVLPKEGRPVPIEGAERRSGCGSCFCRCCPHWLVRKRIDINVNLVRTQIGRQ